MTERRLPACDTLMAKQRTIISNRFASHADTESHPSVWRTRGYLPHFDDESTTQFITYRLANSLPRVHLERLKHELQAGRISEIKYQRSIENFLDQGHGPTRLRNRTIAQIVEENLLRFDGVKYLLLHWVIMLNHVHILLKPINGLTLASIVHSMKSYTANEANKILGESGRFWSIEYFDRYIRDPRHYGSTVNYIHMNPVKGKLCNEPEAWEFGCARHHK